MIAGADGSKATPPRPKSGMRGVCPQAAMKAGGPAPRIAAQGPAPRHGERRPSFGARGSGISESGLMIPVYSPLRGACNGRKNFRHKGLALIRPIGIIRATPPVPNTTGYRRTDAGVAQG